MNVVTVRRPWRQVSPLFGDFHRRLASVEQEPVEQSWAPSAEVRKTEAGYFLSLDIPGVKPADVNIQLEKNVLTVAGKRDGGEAASAEDDIIRSERLVGDFKRSFTLSDEVDAENISAEYAHGVLTLTLARKAADEPRRIQIDVK